MKFFNTLSIKQKITGIFAIVAMSVLTISPAMADSTADLQITCDTVSVSGNTWTLSGTWHAYDFAGQSTQYDAAVFSPAGTLSDSSSKDTPGTFVITNGPSNFVGSTTPAKDDMEGTWSNEITFASVPTSISAALYHAQVPGNEISGDANCTFVLPPVNNIPVASDDTYSVDKDTTLIVSAENGVLKNDTDADLDSLIATINTNVSNGTLVLNTDGSFTYIPNSGFTGTDSFTYKANDGTDNSNTGTVTITVNEITPSNNIPTAVADSYSVNENDTLVTVQPGVLLNDTDADNDSLTATLDTDVSNGTLALNSDGSFSYIPNNGFVGTDTFSYKAYDGTDYSYAATVTITVNAVNHAPVAGNDNYSTDEDITLTNNVLANDTDSDSDTLTAILGTNVSHGTLTLNADGSFTYTPSQDYNGTDSFTYKANDGSIDSAEATVSILVNPVNDTPIAQDDTFSTNEDTVVSGNVLTNDSDVDGDAITATKTIDPQHGTADIATDGTFTYTPALNFSGTDTFKYKVSDGTATSTEATVTVTVTAQNDAPVITLNGATSLDVAVNGTFTDPGATCTDTEDGPIETITVTGSVDMNTVDPYTLTYSCIDSNNTVSNSVSRTVNVIAAPVNNAPVITVNGDTTVTLTQGDTYTDAGAVCTDPEQGTLTVTSSGTVNTAAVGTYTITYSCTDNANHTVTATRTVTVSAQQQTDVCPNITGAQAAVPSGYRIDASGNCVKKSTTTVGGGGYIGSQKPAGEVLGAETSCGIYVDKYLKKGLKGNDKNAVTKVQQFLNDYTHTSLILDGLFGNKTEAALKAFQLAHKNKILDPWKLTKPTGIFYLTTQTEVNNVMCPDLALPVPTNLIPFSANPNTPKV